MSQPIRLPNAQEQHILDNLIVRPITEEECPRWNELVRTQHYLKSATLVGEHLRYVAEYQAQWLALLGWSAPARHLRPRDQWINWSKEQLPCRRHFLANNARFCILTDPHQLPNLGTRALALCCARLSGDWLARWQHPIVAVESFVDGQLFRGTVYKAAGWTRLDDTSGYARVAEDFYERHERPKQLWVRALDDKAFGALSAQTLPPTLVSFEKPTPPRPQRWHLLPRRLRSLPDKLAHQVSDLRGYQGRQHPWRAVLAVMVLAKLCGVKMGQRQIAEFARQLTHPQRRALGCRPDRHNARRYVVPSESTFQRALAKIDYRQFEAWLLQWQNQQLGPATDPLIAIDGKHLRRSSGLAIASAIGQPSQRVHATVTLQKHDSEIVAVRQLLQRTEFTDQMLGLDSLHTQHETLHQILYDHGADYLVPLKENQSSILATAKTLLPESFSPSGGTGQQ